jgi:membrane-associated phospholipid phosphatase
MYRIHFIFLLLTLISTAKAQSDSSALADIWIGKAMFSDPFKNMSSIAKANKKQWIIGGSLTALTLSSFAWDKDIFRENAKLISKNHWIEDYAIINGVASYPLLAGLPIGLWIGGIVSKNQRHSNNAIVSGLALYNTAVPVLALKMLTGRVRPENYTGIDLYGPSLEHWSFPSMHAAGAWSLASCYSTLYPEKKWVSIVSYSGAALISSARVLGNKHWTSDVLIGSLMGYAIGRITAKRHKNTRFHLLPTHKRKK